jgi:hypothetical protein
LQPLRPKFRSEEWNGANDFVFFAKRGELASNRREDHEIRSNHASDTASRPLKACESVEARTFGVPESAAAITLVASRERFEVLHQPILVSILHEAGTQVSLQNIFPESQSSKHRIRR